VTAVFWVMRRLSLVFLISVAGVLGLIVLVEGVEQARGLPSDDTSAAYLEQLAIRVPVLFRDLLPSVFALGVVVWWVRFRRASWTSVQAAGVSLRTLLLCVFVCTMFWSVAFSALTEQVLSQRQAEVGERHWAIIEGRITRSSVQEDGTIEILTLNPDAGNFVEVRSLKEHERDAHLSFLASPEPSMAALSHLSGHPHSDATGWMAWRWVSPLLPAFLTVSLVLLGISTALTLGAYALVAGVLGLLVQMAGKTVVYGGLHPVLVLIALMILSVGLWRTHVFRAYSPKAM